MLHDGFRSAIGEAGGEQTGEARLGAAARGLNSRIAAMALRWFHFVGESTIVWDYFVLLALHAENKKSQHGSASRPLRHLRAFRLKAKDGLSRLIHFWQGVGQR
jgi:hypothetical protein